MLLSHILIATISQQTLKVLCDIFHRRLAFLFFFVNFTVLLVSHHIPSVLLTLLVRWQEEHPAYKKSSKCNPKKKFENFWHKTFFYKCHMKTWIFNSCMHFCLLKFHYWNWPALLDTAYGCLPFFNMSIWTWLTMSGRIGASITAGVATRRPVACPLSSYTLTSGLAAACTYSSHSKLRCCNHTILYNSGIIYTSMCGTGTIGIL